MNSLFLCSPAVFRTIIDEHTFLRFQLVFIQNCLINFRIWFQLVSITGKNLSIHFSAECQFLFRVIQHITAVIRQDIYMISLTFQIFYPGIRIWSLSNSLSAAFDDFFDILCILWIQFLKLFQINFFLIQSTIPFLPYRAQKSRIRNSFSFFRSKSKTVQIRLPVIIYQNFSHIKDHILYLASHLLFLFFLIQIFEQHKEYIAHHYHKQYRKK